MQGTLVPKLTLGPFLTLSVRNGHKLKDWSFSVRNGPSVSFGTNFP